MTTTLSIAQGTRNAGILLLSLLCVCCICADSPDPIAYANDFHAVPVGKPPEDLMILNGSFTVAEFDGAKCLELAADPLDGDGLLFGPAGLVTSRVSARVWAEASGRRFPEFGIGSNDAGGFKLIVVPSQGTIELRRGDEPKASAPFSWKSAAWTRLRLHVSKSPDGSFQIQGKAWLDGTAEPKDWLIHMTEPAEPPAGRASIWGMPYSEKPIRFGELGIAPK